MWLHLLKLRKITCLWDSWIFLKTNILLQRGLIALQWNNLVPSYAKKNKKKNVSSRLAQQMKSGGMVTNFLKYMLYLLWAKNKQLACCFTNLYKLCVKDTSHCPEAACAWAGLCGFLHCTGTSYGPCFSNTFINVIKLRYSKKVI